MQVIALLGLGMDPRAAKRLSELVPVKVHYQIPHEPGESLHDYALRWGHHLQLHREDIVIGMSFAGPIALELAHHFRLRGCILISTFTRPDELPVVHRQALRWGLHRWIPYRLGWWIGRRWAMRNGIIAPDNARAINAIERKTDPSFYRWIIDALGKWPGVDPYNPSLRIHGTGDHIFPLPSSVPDIFFVEGNHFLLSRAQGRIAIREKVDAFIRKLAS